jgi:hypothetical protein
MKDRPHVTKPLEKVINQLVQDGCELKVQILFVRKGNAFAKEHFYLQKSHIITKRKRKPVKIIDKEKHNNALCLLIMDVTIKSG